MHDSPTPDRDPVEIRRRGVRRVRALTASLGAAAAVATGTLAVVVAADHPAQAAGTTSTGSGGDAVDGTGQDDGSTLQGNDDGSSGFSPPATLPGGGWSGSGGGHASSGGS